jgi:hypothetical protein
MAAMSRLMVLAVLAVLAALAAAFGAEPTCSAAAPDGAFSLAMGREVISWPLNFT